MPHMPEQMQYKFLKMLFQDFELIDKTMKLIIELFIYL